MKKKRCGVEVKLDLGPERAALITTRETQAAYLKRMAGAAKAMEKRYGK